MKALLLRVGIDTGSGGSLAPVFKDGTFEYIPIPESKATGETRTYASIVGRSGRRLSEFVGLSLASQHPHFDPEFDSFSYGDPTATKREQLRRLDPGDLLIFYAGLKPNPATDRPRLYAIGYFTVERVYYRENGSLDALDPKRYAANAHVRRTLPESDLVLVTGSSADSRLFFRAVPIGTLDDFVLPDIQSFLSDRSISLRRAVGHWVRDPRALGGVRAWLEMGPASLLDDSSELFSYVLNSDTGFAPNPEGSFCTLATCKPKIRKLADVGDWVVGTCPTGRGAKRITYLMRVNETLTFEKYYGDSRFKNKLPKSDNDGDNIYAPGNGSLVQLNNRHHTRENYIRDTSVDRVLISSLFWYFGEAAPELPEVLVSQIVKSGRGHRRIKDQQIIAHLVSWLSSNYRIGKHGAPSDRGAAPLNGVEPNHRCD